ncbi:hypothetical protein UYSO10_5865 [Kosakonia radicincitans]|nr:hypothetical protein UYSO10_5865 [Kosakonia radicincitans]
MKWNAGETPNIHSYCAFAGYFTDKATRFAAKKYLHFCLPLIHTMG